ncbi:MAG TPA: ABC transporter ATP-binding protein [Oligoflexus sp.]|uniref:ABC transporter ATP-binding protein n=1 Tax=Oligoflexus sp. TaxID=1971216 RepID=UPI002D7ECB8B|nr:ABC transporter ATP-binding protein [Oligoflexus sp.]HET9236822.1 ABC transporter ATP-binding protein [Oligoflexus sp.]
MSLSIQNLSKTYPNGVHALQGIHLNIPTGMFGLLGPNGAGKSSLMRTIATLQDPDSGSIEFHGLNVLHDKTALRRQLGYLPQEFDVYPKTSAVDLLDYIAQLKGIADRKERKNLVERLLTVTNLHAVRKKAVATYSGGMKQRFGIAQALIGDPKLIIVDEPTAGLDPEERVRFHNLLAEISSDVTVILSTHIVSDVSDLCQNFAIINQGRVLAQMTPREALKTLQGKIWEKRVPRGQSQESPAGLVSMHLSMGDQVMRLHGQEAPLAGARAIEPTLEDFYFVTIKGLTP